MPAKKNDPEKQLAKEIKNLSKEVGKIKDVKVERMLIKEIKALSLEIKKLQELEVIKIFKKPAKFMWFSFLKGLMVGFGSVLGATVLVALFIYILSKISFVPIVGEFVEDVIDEVKNGTEIMEEQPADTVSLNTLR